MNNSDAYFNMGVAYGEMGDMNQALMAINKAISMDSQNGRFYYGRAWVYCGPVIKTRPCPISKKLPS